MHRGFLLALVAVASLQAQPPEIGQGYLPEFNLAARQTLQLAEAIPADKYAWRPAPGVPQLVGARKPMPNLDKKVTAKAEVIQWLKDSQADLRKLVKFFSHDATVEGIYLRILVHNHEHMGQMIAYARTMGVKPPWSE